MRKTFFLLTAFSCALLAVGCTGLQSAPSKLTQVNENEFTLTITAPWTSSYGFFRDKQIQKARDVCAKKNLGMMPLDATTDAEGKGYTGTIRFRCVEKLQGPNLGWF